MVQHLPKIKYIFVTFNLGFVSKQKLFNIIYTPLHFFLGRDSTLLSTVRYILNIILPELKYVLWHHYCSLFCS